MKRKNHIFLSVLAMPFLAILGYVVTYGALWLNPLEQQSDTYVAIFYLLMIVFLLAVPYWMVKLFAHAAHKINPRDEYEWNLRDAAKDKKDFELAHHRGHAT